MAEEQGCGRVAGKDLLFGISSKCFLTDTVELRRDAARNGGAVESGSRQQTTTPNNVVIKQIDGALLALSVVVLSS